MTETLFTTCDEWLRRLERTLTEPRAEAELRRRGLDIDTVLAVARMEARGADTRGRSLVSHEELAESTGFPRNIVANVRLALIDAGLLGLAADPARRDSVYRILQTT